MNVVVHYHAFLREKLGRESELLVVSAQAATAGGVVEAFVRSHPQFARLAAALKVAVNDEIVARGAAVMDGARVDLLPPYGGG
jgi:molybdopterin converting factor small subunit